MQCVHPFPVRAVWGLTCSETLGIMKTLGYAASNRFTSLKPVAFDRTEPGADDVAIDVLYCGVCHSDIHQCANDWANTVYPCVPGHEIVGRVSAVGGDVTRHAIGDLVGVGCMIDSCGECPECTSGDQQYCTGPVGWTATYNGPQKPDGTNTYGGFSERVVVREKFVLRIPENLDPAAAAPILCAGATTWSPMQHWGVKGGDAVGVAGLGGLGHMAVKLAKSLGARVTVLTQSPDKLDDARALGADAVIDVDDEDLMADAEKSLDFILSTIPEKHDVNPYIKLLKTNGKIVLVGVIGPNKPIDNMQAIFSRRTIAGSLIGSLDETQAVLDHCAEHGIAPDIEIIDIADINDAFKRVNKGEVRFRYVIDMASLGKDRDTALADAKAIDSPLK